nr:hypothetical protein GCM10020093_041840 [Planobispora longispora]
MSDQSGQAPSGHGTPDPTPPDPQLSGPHAAPPQPPGPTPPGPYPPDPNPPGPHGTGPNPPGPYGPGPYAYGPPPAPPGPAVPVAPATPPLRLSPKVLLTYPLRMLPSLLLPLAGVLFIGGFSPGSFVWAAFGIAGSVVYSAIRWATFTYQVVGDRLELTRALISRSVRTIPLERIRGVDVSTPPLHRLLDIAVLRIDTGAGGGDKQEGELDGVTAAEAERLKAVLLWHARARAGVQARTGPDGAGLTDATPGARPRCRISRVRRRAPGTRRGPSRDSRDSWASWDFRDSRSGEAAPGQVFPKRLPAGCSSWCRASGSSTGPCQGRIC